MIDRFVHQRRSRWQRLQVLLDRARGRRYAGMSADELEELGRLYRQTTSDLAIARRDFPRDRTTRYLEGLIGRAHPVIYRATRGDWTSIGRFVISGFPTLVRESARYTVAAFGLFAIPFLLTFFGVLIEPTWGRIILPASPVVEGIEQGQSWLEIERSQRGLAATSIATNNIQVTFLVFAGGMLLGAGSVLVLLFNGLQIGAIAGMATSYGLGSELSSFVSPHGGIELTVIFIAGGAGLRIGHAMLQPGRLTRGAALTHAARQAIRLMGGCVPLLLLAGAIEGFVSPSGLPNLVKYLFGLLMLVVLYVYLILGGRDGAGHMRATDASLP